ncbi:MAG TPA: hypothetical protein VFK14_11815 [Solirubrobacterales bacterium]|nr:hypothetical protein [Solirubrobacterales bacterium]
MLRAFGIAVFAAAAFASIAAAAGAPTREEYVGRLERVCKPGALATQRAMKGARADVRRERFPAAAGKFAKASSIFGGTIGRIAAVPRPSADAARLAKWFGYLKQQESYLQRITVALRKSQGIKAQRLTARFIHNGNLANNVVLAFGFDYCSFKFSRYG